MVATAQRIASLLLHTPFSFSFISNQAFSPLMSEAPNPPVCLPLTVLLIWSFSWKLNLVTTDKVVLNEQGDWRLFRFPSGSHPQIPKNAADERQHATRAQSHHHCVLRRCGAVAALCCAMQAAWEGKLKKLWFAVCIFPSYWGHSSATSLTFWRHFTKGLSRYSKNSASSSLERFHQRLSSVAISAVLAKASRFLRAPSNGQTRRLKTKRNWTNQYRPQWGMKQLPGLEKKKLEVRGHTYTHAHIHTPKAIISISFSVQLTSTCGHVHII